MASYSVKLLIVLFAAVTYLKLTSADGKISAQGSRDGSEDAKEGHDLAKPEEESQYDFQNAIELLQAINSSLITLNSRVMSLESQIAVLSESTPDVRLNATSRLLQMYKAKLMMLEVDASKINGELLDLTYGYKRALGRYGEPTPRDALGGSLMAADVPV